MGGLTKHEYEQLLASGRVKELNRILASGSTPIISKPKEVVKEEKVIKLEPIEVVEEKPKKKGFQGFRR